MDRAGDTLVPILGPALDGSPGVAAIPDTDDGRWDRDRTWDRAVGPMQFIPSSWRVHGQDGNGDGDRDPNNVLDATLGSAGYLCTGERDLTVTKDRRAAVFSYNHSWDYVDLVLAWAEAYAGGTPVLTGTLGGDPGRTARPAGGGPTRPGADGRSPQRPSPPADEPGTDRPPPPPPAPASSATGGPSAHPSTPLPGTRPTATPDPTETAAATCPGDEPTPTGTPAGETATPDPSPSPTPTPTPTPTATDSPSAQPTGSPTPEPTGTPDPCAGPDASASPTPGATP